jgi:hypothetical protein
MADYNKTKNREDGLNSTASRSTNPLHKLLSHEVTRKQFLKVLGLAVISIFGFSSIIHFFTGKHPSSTIASITAAPVSSSYGHKLSPKSKL